MASPVSGKVRRVDYAPDEYISGVGGLLRADEQGVYWMICTLIMSEGQPVPNDAQRLASLCRIRRSDVAKIVEKLIALGKIQVTEEGRLSQKRAQSEVERSLNRIQTAAENGSKGGRPQGKAKQNQAKPEATGSTAAKLTTNYQPPTVEGRVSEETLDSPKPAKRRHSYPAKFEEFWSQYPTDQNMSKADAGKAFKTLSDEDQDAAITSIPAFRAYCSSHPDYRPVHAVKFIRSRRFDGFNQAAARVNSKVFVKMGTREWEAIRLKRNVASLMNKDHHGEKGWWFEKAEIEEAMQRRELVH